MADKVSIIIPCYNQAQYLPQAIESALGQEYPNVEVIVVDDGSTDNSYEIAMGYKEKQDNLARLDEKYSSEDPSWFGGSRMKVVRQNNMGLALARNAGINASTTASHEYILPLDADDWIEPNYLARTVPMMQDNIAVIGTWASVFGIKNYIWQTWAPTIEQLMIDNSVPVCSLIKRSVLREVGGYNPLLSGYDRDHVGYEDWNLWIDIVKRGYKIAILPECLFHYREKPNSMLAESTKQRSKLITKIHALHTDLWPTGERSMLNKWTNARKDTMGGEYYGIEETYKKAAAFLKDGPVEDWGCGTTYAKKFFTNGYKGVDGTPDYCDTVADLAKYRSQTHGILLRHVLEHNFEWEVVLKNALASCKKLALVVCTPFGDTTRLLRFDEFGIPLFTFRKEDLTRHFLKYREEIVEGDAWGSRCTETIFYVGDVL